LFGLIALACAQHTWHIHSKRKSCTGRYQNQRQRLYIESGDNPSPFIRAPQAVNKNCIIWGRARYSKGQNGYLYQAHDGSDRTCAAGAYTNNIASNGLFTVSKGRQCLWSSHANGWYFAYQTDGNLVEYSSNKSKAVWAAGTNRGAQFNYALVMQTDGNLVVYLSTG